MGQPLQDIGMVLSDIVAVLGLKAQHAGQAACWADDGLTTQGQSLVTEARGAVSHLREVSHFFGLDFQAPNHMIERPPEVEGWVYDMMIKALYDA